MIRRFNYTGRQRIEHKDVRITVMIDGGLSPVFSAELDLDAYRLPPEALVFIEAYRQTSLMRFCWGSVAGPAPQNVCALTELGRAEGVRFRVKVVAPSTGTTNDQPARLLALSERIVPRRVVGEVEQSESLLAVESADIDEVWRLRFDQDGSDEPILLVNSRLVTDRQALVRSHQFVSLVLPEVFRTILGRILLAEADHEPDESASWHVPWLHMAKGLPGVASPPATDAEHRDELVDWIEGCVGAFSRRFATNRRFAEWWTGEAES